MGIRGRVHVRDLREQLHITQKQLKHWGIFAALAKIAVPNVKLQKPATLSSRTCPPVTIQSFSSTLQKADKPAFGRRLLPRKPNTVRRHRRHQLRLYSPPILQISCSFTPNKEQTKRKGLHKTKAIKSTRARLWMRAPAYTPAPF